MTEVVQDITLIDVSITDTSIVVSSVSSTTVITCDKGQIVVADSSTTVDVTTSTSQVNVTPELLTATVIVDNQGVTDHASLTGIGVNTHDEIDAFIDDSLNVETKAFDVTINGTVNFSIPAAANTLLGFSINQLDYVENAVISPPGSGAVIYDPVYYATEIGDHVVAQFSLSP